MDRRVTDIELMARTNSPHAPNHKQRVFINDNGSVPLLYGGAAGGGKSDALLMDVGQHTDNPKFRALLLRRNYPQLAQSGGLLDRAREWWLGKAIWSEKLGRFTFPSGATVAFGHVNHEKDKHNYQGGEYTYIGFDELTQFSETMFTYIAFSRKRGTKETTATLPLKVRAASNPGGEGHAWVKSWFISKDAESDLRRGKYGDRYEHTSAVNGKPTAFIPSRLEDNHALDQVEYRESLEHLDPVTRAQLMAGDWGAAEEKVIKSEWFTYYEPRTTHYGLGAGVKGVDVADCSRIVVVDCAATSEEVARQKRGKTPSHSVITTCDCYRGRMFVRNVDRGFWDFPTLQEKTTEAIHRDRPIWCGVEDEKTGRALIQLLARQGFAMRPLSPEGKGKLERASTLLNMMASGNVLFPHKAPWLDDLRDECSVWAGDSDGADQIDTLAYAAREMARCNLGILAEPWSPRLGS